MKRYPFNRHGRIFPKTPSRTKLWVEMHEPKFPEIIEEKPKKTKIPQRNIDFITSTRASGNNDALGKWTLSPPERKSAADLYDNLLQEQYGFNPALPLTLEQLRELKKLLCDHSNKVECCSQYSPDMLGNASGKENTESTPEHEHSMNVSSLFPEEVADETFVTKTDAFTTSDRTRFTREVSVQNKGSKVNLTNVHISDVPKIKFIAENFSRYKRQDIEVRKLNEKIVCVEYDVFNVDDKEKVVQKLRAYFSIKPPCPVDTDCADGIDSPIKNVPSAIREKYCIGDDVLTKLNEKEIEIIDETIKENRSYLDDLKTILVQKQTEQDKPKMLLDLNYLYDMAKRGKGPPYYDFSKLLTNVELSEIKDLILQRCASSVNGISRKFVKPQEDIDGHKVEFKNTILDLMKDYKVSKLGKSRNR